MSVPVSSVLTNVVTVLNDAGMKHWTRDELLAWGSEGQIELVKRKPDAKVLQREVQLSGGARQSWPADCVALIDIVSNPDGSAVTSCDRPALDRFSPGWMQRKTGQKVQNWMPDDAPGAFFVYPAQSVSSPGKVLATYTAMPAALVDGGNLDVRDIYAANIENYMLYRAYSKDAEVGANAAAAAAYFQAFAQ